MGINADLVTKHFAGPLGLAPWNLAGAGVRAGIRNPAIRDLVITACDQLCGDYFWTRPAAKGNRYHPQVSCGEGGLVRHTMYVCWWALEVMRSVDECPSGKTAWDQDLVTVNHDAVIASCILHDMMKEGDPFLSKMPERQGRDGARLIGGCHGVDMANALLTRVLKGVVEPREHLLMLYSIAGHMGPWTVPAKHNPANITDPSIRHVAQIVHAADYAASRKADTIMTALSGACPIGADPSVQTTKPAA